MHLIYLGCHVMIAASDARDGSDGLLHSHDHGGSQSLTTSERNPSTTPETRAFVPLSSEFRQNGYIEWIEWKAVLQGTLSKRGWTYQECELAPRILHYTHYGILWECRRCIGAGDTEKLQTRRVSSILVERSYSPDSRIFRTLDMDKSCLDYTYIMDRWLYIAEEYSTRYLTYPLDKLPALSGIAAAIASLLNYEPSISPYPTYLAGLSVSNLCCQLFWTSILPCDPAQQTRNTLPSWSWASYPCPIDFHRVLQRLSDSDSPLSQNALYGMRRFLEPDPDFSLVSTDITPDGSDLFGEIHGCLLHIRGRYFDPDVSKVCLRNAPKHPSTKRLEEQEYNDWWAFKYELSYEGKTVYLFFDYVFDKLQNVSLRCLFLLEGRDWPAGIILRAKSDGGGGGQDQKDDVYEKVGIFRMCDSHGILNSLSYNLAAQLKRNSSDFRPIKLNVGEMTLV